ECGGLGGRALAPRDGGGIEPLIMHWDGSRWLGVKSRDPFPHRTFLVDVAASSSTDAVAVGTTESESFVERWNGTRWKRQPAFPRRDANLTAVSPTGWAAGDVTTPDVAGTFVADGWN